MTITLSTILFILGKKKNYNFRTIPSEDENKYTFLAKETLKMIMERAELQLDLIYRQLVSYDKLSDEQIIELDALLRSLYPELQDSDSIEGYMRVLAPAYLDGKLKRQVEAFNSLMPKEYAKLESLVRKKYSSFRFHKNPKGLIHFIKGSVLDYKDGKL